jgi:hypothetical protein
MKINSKIENVLEILSFVTTIINETFVLSLGQHPAHLLASYKIAQCFTFKR